MIRNLVFFWLCLLPLTLGREWLLARSNSGFSATLFWLSLAGLMLLILTFKWESLHHPKLGLQRTMSGGLALIGIFGAINHLGAPLAVAIILLDTAVLFRLEPDRRGAGILFATIGLFIVHAAWGLNFNPLNLMIGLAWACIGIIGRAWGYRLWAAQHGEAESRIWIFGLPLIGSTLGAWGMSGEWIPELTDLRLIPIVIVVATVSLVAYHTTDRIVSQCGALGSRLAELMSLAPLWLGHWVLIPTQLSASQGLLSLLVTLTATWSFLDRPMRVSKSSCGV